jgi:hypothetical protein
MNLEINYWSITSLRRYSRTDYCPFDIFIRSSGLYSNRSGLLAYNIPVAGERPSEAPIQAGIGLEVAGTGAGVSCVIPRL